MTGTDDPFGLDDLDLAALRARPGVKWRRAHGGLAAWVADMDFPVAPAIRDALTHLAETDVGYPDWPALGRSPLPELFVDRMQQRFGWSPDAGRCHELADVMQGVQLAIHHFTRPGDGVVVHMPAYHPFLETIAEMGRRRVDVPATRVDGGWRFDHDALATRLARDPARLLLLCHPHNPTGHVFTVPELEHLADIAGRHGLVVVSDEIHAELVHPGHRHVPFASVGGDAAAKAVTVTSASKAFNLAGLRWAILHAGSADLHHALTELPSHYLGAPNVMAVAATGAAWTAGDGWQRAVAARLDRNRHRLAGLLAAHLPGAVYLPPEATYLAWIDCRPLGLGDDPADTFAARGVELTAGTRFGPQGAGFARLNFATSAGVLERVVGAMGGEAPALTGEAERGRPPNGV